MKNALSSKIEPLCFLVQNNPKVQDGQGEQDGQRIPLWPYVVAITGHRSFAKPGEVEGLPGYDRETIKNAFRKELEQMALLWKKSCNKKSWLFKYKEVNAPLILLTGMADGADQLAAEVALEDKFKLDLNVKVVAVLPMDKELFRLTITDKKQFDSLLKRVYLTYSLPLPDNSDKYRAKIADVDNHKYDKLREKQYKFLGKFLALHCHVMFTFWDGIDLSKTSPGGTSTALHFKLEGNTDEQTVSDMLTYTSVGPVVQFLTPRNTPENQNEPLKGLDVKELEKHKEVAVFYWSKHDLWDKENNCYFYPSREQMIEKNRCKTSVSSMKEIVETFERLGELNWYSINCPKKVKKELLPKSKIDLFDEKNLETLQSKLEGVCDAETLALIDHYTYVDSQAVWFQNRMKFNAFCFLWGVGLFLFFGWLFSSFWEIHQNGWGKGNFFSFVDNGINTFYEIFRLDHLITFYKSWSALNCVTFFYWVGIIVFIIFYGKAKYWKDLIRFYRFRAVAEALRVQIFWRIAEMRNCVSGHYRTHQLHETDWLRTAINGLDVLFDSPKKENFDKTRKERLLFVHNLWIKAQLKYFQKKLAEGEKAHSFYELKILGPFLKLFKCVEQSLGVKTIVTLYMGLWLYLILVVPIMPTNLDYLHEDHKYLPQILQILYGFFLIIVPICGLIKFGMNAHTPQSDLVRYKQMLFPFDRAILLLKPDFERKNIDELLEAEPETETDAEPETETDAEPETETDAEPETVSVKRTKTKLEQMQTILCQLGTEAVSENASWYLSFGERELTLPQ